MSSISERPRVLVFYYDIPQAALDLLKTKCGITIMKGPNRPTKNEVLKLIPECDALFGRFPVDAEFLNAAGTCSKREEKNINIEINSKYFFIYHVGKRLKIISTTSSGYDHLDVAKIKKKRGIKIGYAPKIQSTAVAEIAIFLLLNATRRAREGRLKLEQGIVESVYSWMLGHDLRNKTVGIVGLGKIGVEILKRLKLFEIKRFLYTGHSQKNIGDELGAKFVSFEDLLKDSDFIIVCLPLSSETEKIFDDDAFEKMKNNGVFVNIGRGKTVDTEALVRALKSGTIFAAGLVVTEPEPLPVDHELMKLPNAVIVPHIGSNTIEARIDVTITAAQNLLNGFESKPMLYEL